MPSTAMLNYIFGSFAVIVLARLIRHKRPAPYPPGPKGIPLLGNIFDMPATYAWHTFAHWGRTYGDIIYVNLLGQPVVVLNSTKQAKSMLDAKSSIYSDRPTLQMGELVGWSEGLLMLQYGQTLREQRRYIHSSIGSNALMAKHYEVLTRETTEFLKRLLAKSKDFYADISRTTTGLTLRVGYGYVVEGHADPIAALVDKTVWTAATLSTPGLWLVEALPFLRYLPMWFPGAGFKKIAAEMRQVVHAMLNTPYEYTKRELAGNPELPPSLVAQYLKPEWDPSPESELALKWAAASMSLGGSDTISSAMKSFMLAMTLFPDIQKRAQAEIDIVVGDGRLPSFEDRERLPFVEAIVKEVLCWRPPGPVNFAHCATENNIHNGYFIPKGTSILVNIWAILHDPNTYPNPEIFDPSRFVSDSGEVVTSMPDPYDACFGYGRRRCPGVHFADASIFIWCTMILSVYDISKAVGPDGEIVEPTCEYSTGAISHPEPFECLITPRLEKAKELVLAAD